MAFISALLFAIHPLQVESVAWISASKILLYTYFYLLGLLCYLRFIETNKQKYYWLTILMFVFSFGGKEQAITFPLALIFIDWIKASKQDIQSWVAKIPFILLSVLFVVITIYSHGKTLEGFATAGKFSLLHRVTYAGYSVIEYISKTLVPIKLNYLYLFPKEVDGLLPTRLYYYPITILAIIGTLGQQILKRPPIAFGILFFLIHISLTLHLIPMGRINIVADRYIYLASVGLFFIESFYITKLLFNPKFYKLCITGLVLYTILIGVYSHQRARLWHDNISLKTPRIEKINQ